MIASPFKRSLITTLTVVLLLLIAGTAIGQIDAAAEADAVDSEMIVVGKRPDEAARAQELNATILRQQMYDEIERLRKKETIAWRESELTYKTSEKSRMTFGYDPVEERDLRELTDINEMPGETVKPATLFRAKF